MRPRQAFAALAAAAVLGGVVLAGAAPAAATAVPAEDAATVRLAGAVSPAAPDVRVPSTTITIPLTVTNTSDATLYDVEVSSLRSAPITSSGELTTAFGGQAIEESEFTTRGPSEALKTPLAPGASERVDYVVDSGSEDPGICLCVTGVYALDLLVTAADEQGGGSGPVARTQTYLPSLGTDVTAPSGVGWLWPLLDRPHRFAAGSVFADDDLAASVASGGRLDRALQVVEDVDAAATTRPGVSKGMALLLDPELIDELVTMTRSYTVESADGATTEGTGGAAAAAWLARLAAVLPRHDVRDTAPADPDVVGLAQRGITVDATPDTTTATEVATALGRPGAALPAHDLAWPVGSDLDATGLAALTASGASGVVTTGDTDDDGSVARVPATAGGSDDSTPVLVADPALSEQAAAAIGVGQDTASGLQRLVATAAMTSVAHPEDARFVFVLPDRDLDVDAAAATRAVLATTSLGPPTSPLTALGEAGDTTVRSDLLVADVGAPPGPLAAAVDAAAGATTAAATIRAAVVSGADTVIGDLPSRVQRVASSSWLGEPEVSARATAALTARAAGLADAVRIVVRPTGSYSLASADAPLLLTVANELAVPVRIRVDVRATSRANGFSAGDGQDVFVAARSRQTVRVPTTVTRSGRFDVAVTLRTTNGTAMGPPARITVTSTAVGVVGQIVTYGAGALLVLALLVRGVRRMFVRSRAGSDRPGPDGDAPHPDGTRPEDPSTVPATRP